MKIDLDHLHHWMQAIRQSQDPRRTMDAFWSGQLKSKEWLINQMRYVITDADTIDIHGGWVGVLASMIFQSGMNVKHIRSVDIDPNCKAVAEAMNKLEEIDGRFTAITANMCEIKSDADIIINTSCEHITQEQYNQWIKKLPPDSFIVLQSNNYNISEHIRIANSLAEFEEQSHLEIYKSEELELPLYKRFMIIGKPNV
jgi:hypothetical protein